MKAFTSLVLGLALLFTTAAAASAAPITYVHTGFGSGSLDGNSFGALAPIAFTIEATGDTDNIESCGVTCLFNDNLSASITIGGMGTFAIITPTRYFFAGGSNVVGFSRAGILGSDLYNGPSIAGGWDMATSVGPIAGTGSLIQWNNSPVNTSGGVLVFDSANSAATFTARVEAVPEPATVLLLGIGAACTLRRRSSARG